MKPPSSPPTPRRKAPRRGTPPSAGRLWTWTTWHPGHRAEVTVDAFAADPWAALLSVRRFLRREIRRLRASGFGRRGCPLRHRLPRLPRRAADLRAEG